MKVYKYRNDGSINIDMLLTNSIYAAPFVKLNDPFEATYNEEITKLANDIEKYSGYDTTDIKHSFEEILSYKSKLGIYSSSLTYSIELMWALYTDSHKGFCIEYEIEKLQDLYLAPTTVTQLKVDYKSKPQTITIEDINTKNEILKKLFATKSLKWSHENETRLIFDSSGVKKHHPSALTGIYFGLEMLSTHKDTLINSLQNRDVKFYEVKRIKGSNKLERKLVNENKRQLVFKLDDNSYEILVKRHTPKMENFYVFYKSSKLDNESIKIFLQGFREKFATKDCNIHLIDDKSIIKLINIVPLEGKDYINFADHCFAVSYSEDENDFSWYPYRDFQYEEYFK